MEALRGYEIRGEAGEVYFLRDIIQIMHHYKLGREVLDYPVWLIEAMKIKQGIEEAKNQRRDKMIEKIYHILTGGK